MKRNIKNLFLIFSLAFSCFHSFVLGIDSFLNSGGSITSFIYGFTIAFISSFFSCAWIVLCSEKNFLYKELSYKNEREIWLDKSGEYTWSDNLIVSILNIILLLSILSVLCALSGAFNCFYWSYITDHTSPDFHFIRFVVTKFKSAAITCFVFGYILILIYFFVSLYFKLYKKSKKSEG
jgi:hypothetical protein